MLLTAAFQAARTGERTPRFTDLATPDKLCLEEESFSFVPGDLTVSPDGDDAAEGTPEHPLRTIGRAKAILASRADASEEGRPVHVWLRGGRYLLSEPLRFTSSDARNVIYLSYPGEQAQLCGGSAIRGGWRETTVNGVSAWVREAEDDFTSLYGEKEGAVRRTRFPKEGYFLVQSPCLDGALFTQENTPWEYMLGECAFTADRNDLQRLSSMRNPRDILVRLLHYWKDEMLPLESYDAETGVVRSGKYCSMSPHTGDRYFLENVFESLDEPGEWYLDRSEKLLYYIPLPGETTDSVTLYAAKTERLLEMNGASDVTFRGVAFRDTGWHPLLPQELTDFHPGIEHPQAAYSTPACLTLTDCRNVVFDGCVFRNIGLSGVRMRQGVQDCAVTRCVFRNVGGNCLYIGGENADNARTVQDIRVTDNEFSAYGRNWANAIGVLVTHGRRITIEHNELHDGYYTAISVGWVWGYDYSVTDGNSISYNLIYDVGQGWLSDMGGIYTLGMQPHTVIRGNVIRNVAADPGEGGYGGWGIYLDEGSSGVLVEQNLVYACGSQGFHQHYGKENRIVNNIFALNSMGQMRVTRKEDHTSAVFERNILLSDDRAMYTCVNSAKPKWTDSDNLYWDLTRGALVRSVRDGDDTDGRGGFGRGVMRLRGFYRHGIFADPWFRDAAGYDFTLADNSPAVRAGFVPWNYNEAGTLTDLSDLQ